MLTFFSCVSAVCFFELQSLACCLNAGKTKKQNTKTKTDRQRKYNVTFKSLHKIIIVLENQKLFHISLCVCAHPCVCVWVPGRVDVCMRARACSLAYSACNAYTPYWVICSMSGFTKFFDIIS